MGLSSVGLGSGRRLLMPDDDGWVPMHRRLGNNPYLKEWDERGIWEHLIMLARRADCEVFCKKAGRFGSVISLKRGQLWVSLRGLETRITKIGRIRTILKNFEKGGLISTVTNTSITVITICNYDKYQLAAAQHDTPTNTVSTQYEHSINTQNQEGKEREEKKEESSLRSDSPSGRLIDSAFDVWKETLKGILQIPRKLERDRRTKLRALMKTRMNDDIDEWRRFCQRIADTPFLIGQGNRGWRADLDWILNDKNARKVIEGKWPTSGELNGANGHGTKSSSGGRPGPLNDLFELTADEQDGSGEADRPAMAGDETLERAGGEPQGNIRRLDRPSDEPPDWFDDESGESTDLPGEVVACNR